MSAEDRKRIQERIRLAEASSGLTLLQKPVAAASVGLQCATPPNNVAHIDFARLQEAGIPTPNGGRTRVVDEYRLIKRTILRNAALASPEEHLNLVMVTSAQPGEGKTFTALSLAMSVVADVPVLLVDLDVVKQESFRRLGIRSEFGVIDVLAGGTTLPQVLLKTDVPGLSVLPAGADRPLAHELMAGRNMLDLMSYLSKMYHNGLVILDLAPVLASADASVLASNLGQVILVIEANRTGRASIEQTLSLLQGCKRISLLLNKVEASELIDQYGTYYGEPYTNAKPGAQSVGNRLITYLRNRLLRSNKPGSSH